MNKPLITESGIAANVIVGNHVKIVMPVNLYGCNIGDDCFIGPFTEIQKAVTIGNRTKIQSHSFICEGVSVGDDCFIGHGVMFINDAFRTGGPAHGDKTTWEQTVIGNQVSIGSNATILPVNICDGVVIGAGAVVTKDIDVPGFYVGNPARLIAQTG
jgi:acetyltransferase-like isoleucine patch superfamily enzyme